MNPVNSFRLHIFPDQPLTRSNVAKFLGVYLDEHLTWKYHINFVCKQITESISILSRMCFYLSCKTKLTLHYTLIYPYITYCNSMWWSTYISNLNRIYSKRAVQAITAPLFSKLEFLDIFPVNTLDTAKFMFRNHNNLLPPLFHNLFMTNSQVHRITDMTPEQPVIIGCIPVVRTPRNLQFFTKDLESGTVFLHLLQTCQAFLYLRTKC